MDGRNKTIDQCLSLQFVDLKELRESNSLGLLVTTLHVFQVLLVTSSRRPELWIVPGGGVEPEEEPSVTAVREVLEEAGVIGSLGRCLGVFEVYLIYIYCEWNKTNIRICLRTTITCTAPRCLS